MWSVGSSPQQAVCRPESEEILRSVFAVGVPAQAGSTSIVT